MTKYERLAGADEEVDHGDGSESRAIASQRCKYFRELVALVVGALCFSTILSIGSFSWLRRLALTDATCSTRLSTYNPIGSDMHYQWIAYDSLDAPSIARGDTASKVTAYWESLIYWGAISVPTNKIALLNKSSPTEHYAQTSGGQDGGAIAWLEAFHQMHCLNLLREYIYDDLDSEQNRTTKALIQTHLNHCIMTLKSNIVCQADVTPALFVNAKSLELWDTQALEHKCRSHMDVVRWATEHSVQENAF